MPAANPLGEPPIIGGLNPIEGKVVSIPTHADINEKMRTTVDDTETSPVGTKGASDRDNDNDSEDAIIITGADAAAHLLPMRDDGDPALTFRSLVLASCLSAFQAVMYQIYQVCGHGQGIVQGRK